MATVKFAAFRRKMVEALERRDVASAAKVCIALESEILVCLSEQLNEFGAWEIPSIVAALDRYKSIVLDIAEQRGESRENIQSAADDLNEATGITYVHGTREVQLNDQD